MIQYTTPTHSYVVEGIDLSGCDMWVSYQQGDAKLDVKATTVSYDGIDTTATVNLSQEQTGAFEPGTVKVQLNWVYPNGKRDAVSVKSIDVGRNLIPRVMGYGD